MITIGEYKNRQIYEACIKNLFDEVSLEFDIPVKEIQNNTKKSKGDLAEAKHAMRFLLRHCTNLSFKQIAVMTGAKDHSTAMYSYNFAEATAKIYPNAKLTRIVKKARSGEIASMRIKLFKDESLSYYAISILKK